ncbi:TolC family outer membrane protein [Pseudomonas sp. N040]|uniref:TolC family outer membrane protein n=1 Tax=Pseudomonas sp. N040 TaxID=2785325 RepID=UPI0018A270A1|nr:TolC family outer membrane protein [Pseudomonas sp. N040]MBF7731594.1 TolC family outer membrane protein [Pseudomonas sp. N040]MBW7015238.1 TolC family outer membrane protein [Pseudomonas sp. N040]
MRVLTPLCSAILLATVCTQLQAMTLTEAIQSTLENHPELQATSSRRQIADEEAKIAKGGYQPTVDLISGYGYRYEKGRYQEKPTTDNSESTNYSNAEIRLRQMLFDGFNTPNEVARTEAVANSRAYYVQATAESLALRTAEVYLDVLKRREMVNLAKNNLMAHQRINDQIGLRSKQGVGSSADLDQSQARLALAENNLYTEEVNLADAEANFYSVTGRMPDDLESPATIKGEMPADILAARQAVLVNSPYLKSAQADVQAAEKQYESAKSTFYPRLDGELAANTEDSNNPDYDFNQDEGNWHGWRAGVSMTYNLYNGMRDKAALQAAAYKVNEAMEIRNNALRVINEDLSLAWNALENAKKQTPKARDYADYSARSREAYQQQFGLGQRSLLDLLDSENELFTANRKYTDVRYNEELSMYRVISTTGELLTKKQVVLPATATAVSEVENMAQLLPEMK